MKKKRIVLHDNSHNVLKGIAFIVSKPYKIKSREMLNIRERVGWRQVLGAYLSILTSLSIHFYLWVCSTIEAHQYYRKHINIIGLTIMGIRVHIPLERVRACGGSQVWLSYPNSYTEAGFFQCEYFLCVIFNTVMMIKIHHIFLYIDFMTYSLWSGKLIQVDHPKIRKWVPSWMKLKPYFSAWRSK